MNKAVILDKINQGSFEEAWSLLTQLELEDGIDAEACSMKAAIAVYEGRIAEAERILKQGLSLDSDYEDLVFNMGHVQQLLGKESVAERYYRKAARMTGREDVKLLAEQRIEECQAMLAERPAPLVSIVVLAYNKLEYTKLCIESIYRYTGHIDFELIAVNNASSDETEAYFDALPDNARPVHLAQNQGVVGGFNAGIQAARGTYTACVGNDCIFTARWMDNLLACIESDPSIGYVSPGASYMSNLQQISGDYQTFDEMFAFAERYNHSDPRKWEERVRLMPCVLMVRTPFLQEIGGYDPAFYYGEFADDDISFRIRRAGYKLVYCRDTFTYHFGSVTVRQDQVKNNSMEVSRKIFWDKYKLDAWADTQFSPLLLSNLSVGLSETEAHILGVNAKCGSNPLQLKNMLKERGVAELTITNYCMDEKYLPDLHTVSDRVVEGGWKELRIRTYGMKYNYAVIEVTAEEWNDMILHQANANDWLEAGGQIAMSINHDVVDEELMQRQVRHLRDLGFHIQFASAAPSPISGVDLLLTARKGV
ncbi:glycosyltransferase [Paenibacillus sp. MWE-103]|uniref:Glycosyltransferase n=1 Tax=Paenibacillus artemisiicola TaxID=1172618 RepID=A0ABS3WFY2_9BACL|nr:glycosyltransferase [Paenibacillus artemisiicola]MBO7747241.1 glycosyltransferase [Paenibacillus artemisiicola]